MKSSDHHDDVIELTIMSPHCSSDVIYTSKVTTMPHLYITNLYISEYEPYEILIISLIFGSYNTDDLFSNTSCGAKSVNFALRVALLEERGQIKQKHFGP